MEKILANTVYSDSTLKSWNKKNLIELIRVLEHNWANAEQSLNIQAKNCEMLLEQEKDKIAEYERKLSDGELVSKEWHDEQVLHAENEIEELKKEYIKLDLECRELRTELDKELAEHEEFTKKANKEIESLKSKSSFKDSWKNKFFKAKEEVERLTEENEYLDGCAKQFLADYQKCETANTELQELNAKYYNEAKDLRRANAKLQKQVDELKANQVIECHGMFKGCDMVKQAVKDTAKEILLLSKDMPTYWDFVKAIKEKYSVEVE